MTSYYSEARDSFSLLGGAVGRTSAKTQTNSLPPYFHSLFPYTCPGRPNNCQLSTVSTRNEFNISLYNNQTLCLYLLNKPNHRHTLRTQTMNTQHQAIIANAINLIESQCAPTYADPTAFTTSDISADYFKLRLANEDAEHFEVAFLDNQHMLIKTVRMFSGTINAAAVYPREIFKLALELNAAAIVIAHNHPSGVNEPSQADKMITRRIKDGCAMCDVSVLDHVIVARDAKPFSFAKAGLL